MRVATEMTKEKANVKGVDAGTRWSYIPGNSLPPTHKDYYFNSEQREHNFLSLFTDDTTSIGGNQEIAMGIEIIEEVMENFEKQTNKSSQEHVISRDSESGNTRHLART